MVLQHSDRNILLNTLYQMVGKVGVSLFGIIITIFLTRYLNPVGFSEYSFIFGFVGLIAIIPDLGLLPLLIRKIASGKEEKDYFSGVFTLRLMIAVLAFGASFLLLPFLPYTDKVKIGIILASTSSILLLLSGIFWATFQAKLQFKTIVISQGISAIAALLLTWIGIFLHYSFYYFILVSVLAAFVGYFYSYIKSAYKDNLISVDIFLIFKIVRHTAPFAGWVLVSVVYFKIDSLILSFYYNPSFSADVGYYALAYKLFEVVLVFGSYFNQTLYPVFAGIIGEKIFIKTFNKYLLYTSCVAIASTIGLFVFARSFVLILGGKSFEPAIVPVQILSLAVGVSVVSGYFLNVAASAHKEKLLFRYAVITLILNIILNMIFIPTHSYIAASWITVICQVFIFLTNTKIVYSILRSAHRLPHEH